MKCLSTRRWKYARGEILRAFTPRPGAVTSSTSPASTILTKQPEIVLDTVSPAAEENARMMLSHLVGRNPDIEFLPFPTWIPAKSIDPKSIDSLWSLA